MTPEELSQASDTLVLDVRLADDYEAEHLEGAHNNAVFEVAFNGRMPEIAPDKNTEVVVYGWNDSSQEAAAAAEKLTRDGYTKVAVLEGGLEGAKAAGLTVTTGTPVAEDPATLDGTLAVDTAESRVGWTGRNLLNRHWGEIAIESGSLNFAGGKLSGGSIVLDLKQITASDLAGSDLHDVLIAHLQNDDFFDVENHPKATLDILKAEEVDGPGAPNLAVTANLTLRGVTEEISFTATTGVTPEGKAAAQATFSIDRTRWGVLYGSGKFFHRLAGHLVNDLIDFEVKIVTA